MRSGDRERGEGASERDGRIFECAAFVASDAFDPTGSGDRFAKASVYNCL